MKQERFCPEKPTPLFQILNPEILRQELANKEIRTKLETMTRGRGGRVKRERSTSAAPPPLSKRLRGPSLAGDPPPAASASPSQVVVTGLPSNCSVLELKSRLEQFGSISRIKIHGSGSGDVTFRSDMAAQAAILASLEPDLGISVGSCKVLVVRPSKLLMKENTEIATRLYSRLLRPEPPLRKHGRSNKSSLLESLVQTLRTNQIQVQLFQAPELNQTFLQKAGK